MAQRRVEPFWQFLHTYDWLEHLGGGKGAKSYNCKRLRSDDKFYGGRSFLLPDLGHRGICVSEEPMGRKIQLPPHRARTHVADAPRRASARAQQPRVQAVLFLLQDGHDIERPHLPRVMRRSPASDTVRYEAKETDIPIWAHEQTIEARSSRRDGSCGTRRRMVDSERTKKAGTPSWASCQRRAGWTPQQPAHAQEVVVAGEYQMHIAQEVSAGEGEEQVGARAEGHFRGEVGASWFGVQTEAHRAYEHQTRGKIVTRGTIFRKAPVDSPDGRSFCSGNSGEWGASRASMTVFPELEVLRNFRRRELGHLSSPGQTLVSPPSFSDAGVQMKGSFNSELAIIEDRYKRQSDKQGGNRTERPARPLLQHLFPETLALAQTTARANLVLTSGPASITRLWLPPHCPGRARPHQLAVLSV
ncbi:hypothetical protein C8J57DRAFT_1477864 [Mycena rebaudengoi]|nr:hypothetical protein C8J57DRAFT_1477864 [Mycena rebaudengoi]